ncbi:MAG: hypothetical protein GTO18_14280 [Anaerolineales bacterium]|nr:hypothetical protein [Anaerolineales bacterium]
MAGRTIEVSGDVKGSLFAVGGRVDLTGNINGGAYIAARDIEMAPDSAVGRNFYFITARINTQKESTIGRDLVGVSLSGRLSGEVSRDVIVIIGLLQMFGRFREEALESYAPLSDVEVACDSVRGAPLGSLLPMMKEAARKAPQLSSMFRDVFNVPQFQRGNGLEIDRDEAIEWVVDRLGTFFALLVLGAVGFWLIPGEVEDWAESIQASPLLALGYGFLGIIVAANLFVLFWVIVLLIIGIGIGLGLLTLWEVAFIFWGVVLSSLILALSLMALLVFYGSKVIVSYLTGKLIMERLAPDIVDHRVLTLSIGLILYGLLSAIPYFGPIVGIAATVFGVGDVWLVARDRRAAKKGK